MCENLKEKVSGQEYQGLKNIIVPVNIKTDKGERKIEVSLNKDSCPHKGDEMEDGEEDKKKIQEVNIASMTFVVDPGFERQNF